MRSRARRAFSWPLQDPKPCASSTPSPSGWASRRWPDPARTRPALPERQALTRAPDRVRQPVNVVALHAVEEREVAGVREEDGRARLRGVLAERRLR